MRIPTSRWAAAYELFHDSFIRTVVNSKKLVGGIPTPLKIKGPDNPTRQLLPIMSAKGCSRDREGRKGKGGGGEGSKS